MHDANFTGKKASQSQVHAWFVLDRDYCGRATISPVSINAPDVSMPWVNPSPRGDNGYHRAPRGTSRGYVLARAAREGRTDLAELVDSGALSARAAGSCEGPAVLDRSPSRGRPCPINKKILTQYKDFSPAELGRSAHARALQAPRERPPVQGFLYLAAGSP
jgi:hypothetical protein